MSTAKPLEGIIYRIQHNDQTKQLTYVGSCQLLERRISDHKYVCNNEAAINHNIPLYKTMRANGGFENFTFDIIEQFKCATIVDLRKREQEWIDKLQPNMNSQRAYSSPEQNALTRRAYREKEKATFIDCPCGKTYPITMGYKHRCTLHHKLFVAMKVMNGGTDEYVYCVRCNTPIQIESPSTRFSKNSTQCEICLGWYSGPNVYKHRKSKIHLDAMKAKGIEAEPPMEKPEGIITCDLCGGYYQYSSQGKYQHNHTKKHLAALSI